MGSSRLSLAGWSVESLVDRTGHVRSDFLSLFWLLAFLKFRIFTGHVTLFMDSYPARSISTLRRQLAIDGDEFRATFLFYYSKMNVIELKLIVLS